MKKLIVTFGIVFFGATAQGQKLHRDFVLSMSHGMRPTHLTGLDSVDILSVAICLAPDGTVVSTDFSGNVSEEIKADIKKRFTYMDVGRLSLSEYWKKFCTDNNIKTNTCFVQTNLLRHKHSDNQVIKIPQLTEKFDVGLTMGDTSLFFKRDVNVILFPPMVMVFEDTIKE